MLDHGLPSFSCHFFSMFVVTDVNFFLFLLCLFSSSTPLGGRAKAGSKWTSEFSPRPAPTPGSPSFACSSVPHINFVHLLLRPVPHLLSEELVMCKTLRRFPPWWCANALRLGRVYLREHVLTLNPSFFNSCLFKYAWLARLPLHFRVLLFSAGFVSWVTLIAWNSFPGGGSDLRPKWYILNEYAWKWSVPWMPLDILWLQIGPGSTSLPDKSSAITCSEPLGAGEASDSGGSEWHGY